MKIIFRHLANSDTHAFSINDEEGKCLIRSDIQYSTEIEMIKDLVKIKQFFSYLSIENVLIDYESN